MRSRFKSRRFENQDAMSAINLTSLMDLMCVLLIVFIVALPGVFSSISVNLPTIESPVMQFEDDTQYVEIALNKDGQVFVNDVQSSFELLVKNIASFNSSDKKYIQIVIKADEDCIYKQVADLMSFLNINGYQSISLLGKKVQNH